MNAPLNPNPTPAPAVPTASERIRARLVAAGRRFHANDNISDVIQGPGELAALEDEVATRLQALL